MKCSLSPLLLLASLTVSASCTRTSAASLVPKLDLSFRLTRTRDVAASRESAHTQLGLGAWLRWQPVIAAAYVPERFELSPSAFMAPCDADDTVCFAEFAQDEREVAQALQEAP